MGTGFSIDTPVKVAQYGITSVISLVDDALIEQMRRYYCELFGKAYTAITKYDKDFRAHRITAYLNLVDEIVQKKFEAVRSAPFSPTSEITKYFDLLPEWNPLKDLYHQMLRQKDPKEKKRLQNRLRQAMRPGDIEVNIMTKLDRTNFDQTRKPLAEEFCDALAALRGFAQSTLRSALVLSAGINRRLYSYMEKFEDFYTNASGEIRKKIVLKVSDYRSSLTQGKFLAKKGLWVSEYRIESGLNCGGHAFASEGFLLGPILEEFKNHRQDLIKTVFQSFTAALKKKNRQTPSSPPSIRVTAQGGIGTAQEDAFLRQHYRLDRTGWATPFLLVPEVTNVDQTTLALLCDAKKEDLYLSDSSPLGVPFNNLRNSPSERERQARITKGRPGSPCPKGYLVSNTEFTETPICTASRQYQQRKLKALEKEPLDPEAYRAKYTEITNKSCICHDLAAPPLINHHLGRKGERLVTAVCPGPNLAYFSKVVSLKEMVDHIYGRANLLTREDRPHMFMKELGMYVDYLVKKVKKELAGSVSTPKQKKYFKDFLNNLLDGLDYYERLFGENIVEETPARQQQSLDELADFRKFLTTFAAEEPCFTEEI